MSAALPIEPGRSLEGINRKRKDITNPRHLHMLDMLEAHLHAELAGDLEAIMATLVPEPAYHFWGGGVFDHFTGQDETRRFYLRLFETGSNTLERTYDRMIVDDYGIFADGVIQLIMRGEVLERQAANFPHLNIDLSRPYLTARQSAVVLPFSEDGLMVGEDVYSHRDMTFTALD